MTDLRFRLYTQEWLDDYYLKTTFVKRTTWNHEFKYYSNLMFYYTLIGIEFMLLILYKSFLVFTYLLDVIVIRPFISKRVEYDKKTNNIIEKLIIKCMNAVDNVNDYPDDLYI